MAAKLDPTPKISYAKGARATKSFRTGGSVAVRIPKEFQLTESDLMITKVSEGLLITPAPQVKSVADWWNGWSADPDFMRDGRQQPAMQQRDFD